MNTEKFKIDTLAESINVSDTVQRDLGCTNFTFTYTSTLVTWSNELITFWQQIWMAQVKIKIYYLNKNTGRFYNKCT